MAPVDYARYPQPRPHLFQRAAATSVMGLTGLISKFFLKALSSTQVVGMDKFVKLLEEREDPNRRERGLITVSNHMCIVDDPLIWGVLPWRTAFNPDNHRWSLGAHDICYASKPLGTFFGIGQVLPTHRGLHSPYGGIAQPTMTQAIRLLSAYPYNTTIDQLDATSSTTTTATNLAYASTTFPTLTDPFSSGALTYSTTPSDVHFAPSAYLSRRHAWVHIFPEGFVHQQSPQRSMRYFKWGVARLILESEPMPDLVPIFIDGTADVFAEDRGFPRFLPRPFRKVLVAFGDKVDMQETFGDLRERWRKLQLRDLEEQRVARERERREEEVEVEKRRVEMEKWAVENAAATASAAAAATTSAGSTERRSRRRRDRDQSSSSTPSPSSLTTPPPPTLPPPKQWPDLTQIGHLSDNLLYSQEAQEIRREVAKRVRDQVIKVRRAQGYPEEDPSLALAETWKRDLGTKEVHQSPVDGSLQNPKI